ncbi:HNH endonuclease [Geodermatophilus obscurus]|uniref:HNH endonuclease n=1 Tax=Geodermatophilus obscurus TaxID=1861 RepID=A0A1I5EMD9_9ACTN|nr:HNH endonuclease signature motif containing protein [Geodermatophilus obscurus]SFO12493.1 HNH endonuclease [Geodermatophilus obscurus]
MSEFSTAELALVLNCGRVAASKLAHRAWTLRESLPATWAALAAGVLDEYRARILVEVLEYTDPGLARRVEARLLPEAATLTAGKLKKRALELLLELDPDAGERRREQAQRHADVRLEPSPEEGMARLTADLPAEVAAACHAVIDALAAILKADGDPRPIGQLRTQVAADLILRPWDDSRPPVTAHLQITATLASLAGASTGCGAVNGLPITAAHLRDLLARLDALGLQAPDGGSVTVAVTDDDGTLRATGTLDQLRRIAARGCPNHPEAGTGSNGTGMHTSSDIETDSGTGTDSGTDCGCPVLDRPGRVNRYTPSAAQQAFIRTRDRTCRFPTCGQRVGWADTDHVIPHASGGTTDCANLCCLCRSHHRLKTFAHGWRFTMTPDGTLTVTTPSGITRTTRPPGMRPPPAAPDPPPEAAAPPPTDPDDDPPPF